MSAKSFAVELVVGIKDLFSGLADGIKAEARDMRREFQRTTAETDQQTAALKDLAQGAERASTDLAETGRDAKDAGQAQQLATRATDRHGAALRDLAQGAGRAGSGLERVAQESRAAGSAAAGASRQAEDLGEALGGKLADGAKAFMALAGGGALVQNVVALDQQLKMLAGQTDLTVAQAQAMAPLIQGARIAIPGATIEEITQATRAIIQQTALRGEAAAKAARDAVIFTKIHPDQDLDTVIAATAVAAKAFGVEPAKAMDLFATAIQRAGDGSTDLLEAFKEYSAGTAEAGYSIVGMTAAYVAAKKEGLFQYDKIGDVMKEAAKARITDADEWAKLMGDGGKSKGIIGDLLTPGEAQPLRGLLTDLRAALAMGSDVTTLTQRLRELGTERAAEISGAGGRAAGDGPKAKALQGEIAAVEARIADLRTGAEDTQQLWGRVLLELGNISAKDITKGRNITEGVTGSVGAEDMTGAQLQAVGKALIDPTATLGADTGALNTAYAESTTFLDRLTSSWTRLQTQIEIGIADIGGWLAPVGDGIIWLLDGAGSLAEGFRGLALGAGAAAGIGGTLSGLAAGLGALGIGIGIAGAPVWAIALAIGAVVAAGYELWRNWDYLAGEARRIWGGVADWWSNLDLGAAGATMMRGLGTGLVRASVYPLRATMGLLRGVSQYVARHDLAGEGAGLMRSLARGARGMWGEVTGAFSGLIDYIRGIIAGWNLWESGKALMASFAAGIRAAGAEVYAQVQATLAEARKLLPFSDAKEGPLSDLTLSGRRLVETLATGVAGAGVGVLGGPLAALLAGALDALDPGGPGQGRGLLAGLGPRGLPERGPGAGTGAVTVAPQYHIHVSGVRGAEDLGAAVVDAIRGRSSELMAELERALEAVWDRQAYRTHGY